MSIRPTVVPLTSLADAASLGVDLALQDRAASISTGNASIPGFPGGDPSTTTGIWEPPTQDPYFA
jgi:hypothetical protein